MNTLCIDVGGSKFSAALFDGDQMVHRETRATNRAGGPKWMVSQIFEVVQPWLADLYNAGEKLDRCGIGFGGPVDFIAQRVALSTHVEGWKDFPLPAAMSERFSVPVAMDNDANVGALGEAFYGAALGHSHVFYMTISTGIGGGIVLGGEVWRGSDGWAGEIGHINVRPDGPECLCGSSGCLERMCGGLWLERDYGKPAKELLQDPEFTKRYVVDLARGIKAAIMILNPSRIVIGGGIGKAGDALFVPLREELARQIPTWSGARVDVVPAELTDNSVLYGALHLAKRL